MSAVLAAVLPVFLVLGAGYGAVRTGWMKGDVADALNAFAIRLAVPVLLFRGLIRIDLAQAFAPSMLVSFYAGVWLCFVLAIVLARLVWKRRPGEAVAIGFAAMFSNIVMLGLPITERAFGPAALAAALGLLALHAPSNYLIGTVTMELSRRDGRPLGETLREAARAILVNPLMIGILAGAACNLAGLTLPGFAMAAVDMIAEAAVPAALVGIGAAMTRYSLREDLGLVLTVSALSLVVHPLVTLGLGQFAFALPPSQLQAAVTLAAMPPGLNIYVFALLYGRAVALSASTMLLATIASLATITAWLLLVQSLTGAG